MEKDIRWIQRFQNYQKALLQLQKFIDQKSLNELEEQGLIKAFEYSYELAWKTLQDLIAYRGFQDIYGPRPVIQKANNIGLIKDGEGWLKMIQSRNLTSHTYNEETADEISAEIINSYYSLFIKLKERLDAELNNS